MQAPQTGRGREKRPRSHGPPDRPQTPRNPPSPDDRHEPFRKHRIRSPSQLPGLRPGRLDGVGAGSHQHLELRPWPRGPERRGLHRGRLERDLRDALSLSRPAEQLHRTGRDQRRSPQQGRRGLQHDRRGEVPRYGRDGEYGRWRLGERDFRGRQCGRGGRQQQRVGAEGCGGRRREQSRRGDIATIGGV